jgi:hypothetical protein
MVWVSLYAKKHGQDIGSLSIARNIQEGRIYGKDSWY